VSRLLSGSFDNRGHKPLTEPDWFAQLEEILAAASDEAAQRFSAACCRRVWDCMDDPRHRALVEAAESLVDNRIGQAEFEQAMAPVVELWADLPPRGPDGPLPWQQWLTWHHLTGATRHLGSPGGAVYAGSYAARAAASHRGEEGSGEWGAAWSREIDAQRELAATLLGSPDSGIRPRRTARRSLSRLWKPLDPEAMAYFAARWLAELRDGPPAGESAVGQAVAMMNFAAAPEQQWLFIRSAVAQAATDDELGHVAAGPLEHILGRHGDQYIAAVEEEAARDAKFARMLTGVWKYMMSDEVWGRVQAIQARVPAPLKPSECEGQEAESDAADGRSQADG
jgi:hypothetical protein